MLLAQMEEHSVGTIEMEEKYSVGLIEMKEENSVGTT